MVIDAHNHPNWWGHDANRILANMDAAGIDQTWLFSWECHRQDYDPKGQRNFPPTSRDVAISFEQVLEVGKQAPDRFVLGYIPHPKQPDAIDRLRSAVEVHGVRVASELKVRVTFDDPDAIDLYRVCGELGLPITIHLDYPISKGGQWYPRPNYWYGGSIEAFERAIIACPETTFIGHAPGFWAHISKSNDAESISYPTGPVAPGGKVLELFDTYPNLHADLSAGSGLGAISRDREFGKQFLIDYQDRLIFGRDQFHDKLMDYLKSLDLPKAAFDKITFQNAQKLIGDA